MHTYQGGALQALADPTRRQIFEVLAEGPHSVTAIAGRVPISRPAVSQHLKVLRDGGLVSVRAEGTRRVYTVDPAGVAEIRAYFEQFWTRSLAAFAQAVDNPTEETT